MFLGNQHTIRLEAKDCFYTEKIRLRAVRQTCLQTHMFNMSSSATRVVALCDCVLHQLHSLQCRSFEKRDMIVYITCIKTGSILYDCLPVCNVLQIIHISRSHQGLNGFLIVSQCQQLQQFIGVRTPGIWVYQHHCVLYACLDLQSRPVTGHRAGLCSLVVTVLHCCTI